MLQQFDPNRPQLLALMYARFAEILVKGPQNNFSAWDTSISRSINSLQELRQLTARDFVNAMAYAGLRNSEHAAYKQASRNINNDCIAHQLLFNEQLIRRHAKSASELPAEEMGA